MQRFCTMIFAAALLVCFLVVPARAGIGFRVNGGLTYVTYADFNDYIDNFNELELPAMGVTETLDNIHWMPEVNGEIFFTVLPSIDIGAGAGLISGKSEFTFGIADVGFSYEHAVKAYPLAVTGYFTLPLPGAAIKPFLFGGVAAVYSKISFDAKATAGGITEGLDAELTTWGYALHGGGGVRFTLFPRILIDLGVKGRWANLDGYEGTGNFLGEGSTGVYLAKGTSAGSYLFGPETLENKDQYEEASVDLSGFAVTVGMTVSF